VNGSPPKNFSILLLSEVQDRKNDFFIPLSQDTTMIDVVDTTTAIFLQLLIVCNLGGLKMAGGQSLCLLIVTVRCGQGCFLRASACGPWKVRDRA
jgi:hypothetical protein